ncbi:unnamed protein product [Symbiodinium sp. CCMP2592]|nr:unnamed protein product [Symbiodinium sp. CCMP2592]
MLASLAYGRFLSTSVPLAMGDSSALITPRSDDEDRLHPSLKTSESSQHGKAFASLVLAWQMLPADSHGGKSPPAVAVKSQEKPFCGDHCRPCIFVGTKTGCHRHPCAFCHSDVHVQKRRESNRRRSQKHITELQLKKSGTLS